jgi:hypothetical protein
MPLDNLPAPTAASETLRRDLEAKLETFQQSRHVELMEMLGELAANNSLTAKEMAALAIDMIILFGSQLQDNRPDLDPRTNEKILARKAQLSQMLVGDVKEVITSPTYNLKSRLQVLNVLVSVL